ncbi:MAG TPA: Lrp/AsnC family transcriptional regulator [Pseudonocardiaceae bacterium]|jgi:Lrp/AsnC family leucine-responsive transcriptional regulator|nr:Lrp/AsnC family transcriptional regulator [Pseudonocardiaceae bacterium]
MNAPQLLDEVNVRLLAHLQADPRITMSALARQVGMSAPAVTERVQRLEQAGVITGYSVDVDPAALGYPVTVFVRVRITTGRLDRFAAFITTVPEVVEGYRVTGEDCYLLKLHIPRLDDLAELLDRFMLHGSTTSLIVVATPIKARPLPLPGEAQTEQVG